MCGRARAPAHAMEQFYCDLFLEDHDVDVFFAVSHVTNYYASKWFQRLHGYQDLDGRGHRLGKLLFDIRYGNDYDGDY